jgi:hypothetical protein
MMPNFSEGQYFSHNIIGIQQYHIIKLINLKHCETLKYFANRVFYIYSSSCYWGKMMHVNNKLWNDLEYLPDPFFIHNTSLVHIKTACKLNYNKKLYQVCCLSLGPYNFTVAIICPHLSCYSPYKSTVY